MHSIEKIPSAFTWFREMKYLFVIPYFVPAFAYGGPVKGVYARASGLVRCGHAVTVFTTDVLDARSRNTGPIEKIMTGIKVRYFKVVSNKLAYYLNYYRAWGYRAFLERTIREYDFVFIHDYFTYQTRVTADICSRHGVPYAITPHGSLNPIRLENKYWIKQLFLISNRHIFANCEFVVALTETEKKILSKYKDESTIHVLPNGIDMGEFSDISNYRGGLRHRLGLLDEKLVVFVGRIHHIKGLDILVRAFALVVAEINNARLIVVGPDEGYKSILKRVVSDEGVTNSVQFTGLLNGTELKEVFADADLYVLSSYDEGFPISVLEATASGVPCVISTNCNIPEIGKIGAGYIVENDPEELASRIVEVLKDKVLRQSMSQKGIEMVNRQFTWDSVVERLESLSR